MIFNVRGTNGCLHGDSLIDCPRDLSKHPRGIPIRELVGKQFWTYCWDFNNDTMTLGWVSDVWKSGRKTVYRVPLSAYQTKNSVKMRNGKSGVGMYQPPCEIVGTYDHPVLLSDGTWKKLGELQVGDSIKSLYRRHQDRGKIYWTTSVRKTQEHYGTPRGPIRNFFTYQGVTQAISEQQFICTNVHGPRPDGAHVHHLDSNPYNHDPSNLEWKDGHKHASDHARERNLKGTFGKGTVGWQKTGSHPRGMLGKKHSPEARERIAQTNRERHAKRRYEEAFNHRVLGVPERVGTRVVYDMEVVGHHNFVANGVVVHNSGKSTLVRKIFSSALSVTPKYGLLGYKQPEAYELVFEGIPKPLYILGPYRTAAGGCDQVRPYDSIFKLLDKYHPRGHVLFEGVIISSAYGRIGKYLEQFGKDAVMVFLTTSLEDCLKHIGMRRDSSPHNKRKDFNRKQVADKFRSINKYKEKIREEDILTLLDLSVEDAVERILTLMQPPQRRRASAA